MSPREIIDRLAEQLGGLFARAPTHTVPPLPASAHALLAWALHTRYRATVLCITDGRHTLDALHRDLETLSPGDESAPKDLLYFPAREDIYTTGADEDPEITGYRLKALAASGHLPRSPGVVVTCVQALMQPALSVTAVTNHALHVSKGGILDIETCLGALAGLGYDLSFEVSSKGEACARGGILDVWPVTSLWPIRIELFGDEVESIRIFDPATQRSLGIVDSVVLDPYSEDRVMQEDPTARAWFMDALPRDTVLYWVDRDNVQRHAELQAASASAAPGSPPQLDFAALCERLTSRPEYRELVSAAGETTTEVPLPRFDPVPAVPDLRRKDFSPDLQETARGRLLASIRQRSDAGDAVTVYLETSGAEAHFRATLAKELGPTVDLRVGALSEGVMIPDLNVVLVAETDLYGRHESGGRRYVPAASRGGPAQFASVRVNALSDIEPGDHVVHVEHGLGRYLGLFDITVRGKPQEVLSIEYANGARLHVPVAQAHLLSRYVGVSVHNVRLHRLGGGRWDKEKQAAQLAIQDIASALLQLQAERAILEGHSFSSDNTWQHEFEASFPYHETADQARVIDEVKQDMEATRPMDRLICGDAGYGKTEVAMRAAFKTVMDTRQVALLVPTTILAQQHFDTFRERMAGYPVRVEMLSRFRTQKERRGAREGMQDGSVDIVIGTHALLQDEIGFRDLGLVIIDEEQRFGVVHKEKLKELRRLVDVLTMTATPIPRTMYLSLTGARDISLLQTPPRERMAIETIVAKDDDDLIRTALVRELNREGQVFFLHNRVMTIGKVRQRLETLVPQARFEIAHGQMPTSELEAVMHRFIAGQCDVLICTTIIESGVDIPRVNTILIDRADRFGIAELYQLRGRVGRSNRRAYAYLLLPERGHIEPDAQQRIAALRKFSGLSAGFSLAMRDLEIRGAGNLLGAAQSGHINAIGFGLYCQLLNRTVAGLKREDLPPLVNVSLNLDFIDFSSRQTKGLTSVSLPYAYIEDEPLRIATYRDIAEATSRPDIEEIREGLKDRFGPIPPPVARVLRMAEIRITAAIKGLVHIETRDGKLMLRNAIDFLMEHKRFPRLQSDDPDQRLDEIEDRIRTIDDWCDP